MRALHRLEQHRHRVELVVGAREGEFLARQPLHHDLKGLVIHLAGFAEIDGVGCASRGTTPRPTPSCRRPPLMLIEHADFFDQPDRMIERQQIDHRSEPQGFGALRDRRQIDAGRRGHAERRRMVLRDVVAVDAGAFIGLRQAQAIFVKFCERNARVIHVVEHAEFHRFLPKSTAGLFRRSANSR